MKLLSFPPDSQQAGGAERTEQDVEAPPAEAEQEPPLELPHAASLNLATYYAKDYAGGSPLQSSVPTRPRLPSRPARLHGTFRIFNVHLRTPTLLLAGAEGLVLYLCIATACVMVHSYETWAGALMRAENITLGATMWLALAAMGLYRSGQRDGVAGLLVRTSVAVLILAPAGMFVVGTVLVSHGVSVPVVLLAAGLALPMILLTRLIGVRVFNENLFKPRVLVLGTGNEAQRLTERMRRRSDRQGFEIIGFLSLGSRNLLGASPAAPLLALGEDQDLLDLCLQHDVDEIVLAWDDRRGSNASQRMPLSALLNCKMAGIAVTELTTFFEREAGRIDVDILRASWLLFSQGFHQPLRRGTKRLFDILAAGGVLALAWPLMLLVAVAIKLEDGWRAPVLYRQRRVGLNGREYEIMKFRSMRADAERSGEAVWAKKDDPRATRVGRTLRALRLDELPQLFNVLLGEMAFVGPRPERAVFVAEFTRDIPFYADRHRVKPGLTGWAQINYPYGASATDARRKLEYDLYYAKNYSLLLDLIIMIRTVEVVLVGRGAR